MKENYLGFTVSDKNIVQLPFDRDEYKEIICNAHSLGLTPLHYCMLMMSPCDNCGNDKIILSKLTTLLSKQFKGATGNHLFCFINSKLNTGLIETKLKLNYSISYLLSISENSKVYAPKSNRNNFFSDSNATITIFSEDIKIATMFCKIKNNQVYQLQENI